MGPARSGRPDDRLREAHADFSRLSERVGTALRAFAHPARVHIQFFHLNQMSGKSAEIRISARLH
jgi:hypothetical protein